ncbi:hypothetical protein EV127DRAFT_413580 [Xylaria flabelliformis]|nr:hypothetical protein EV127DRAFT_413580 [Xylaria flabelliformis]
MSDQAAESEATSRPSSTQEDLEEIKKDVKQLVQALRSLAPKTEADEPQRQSHCDPEEWLKWIRPTPERLETFDHLLSLMFIEDDAESSLGISQPISRYSPSFARDLTLRFVAVSGPQDISLRIKYPRISVAQIREYIMGLGFAPNAPGSYQVNETSDTPLWPRSYFDHELYYVSGNIYNDLSQYDLEKIRDKEELDNGLRQPADCGCGTLCLVTAPVEEGILDLRPVKFVLAQISRWNYTGPDRDTDQMHSSLITYFIGVFAGYWPSRNERSYFSRIHQLIHQSQNEICYSCTLQVHFRYFTSVELPLEAQQNAGGLRCHREHGQIFSKPLNVTLKERRISVIGLIFAGSKTPAFHSVLAMGEVGFGKIGNDNLKWRPGLEGTIAFQIALLVSVDVWEREWNSVLDSIDDCIRFRLDQTLRPKEIEQWMFDDNFERSRLYLTILQTLRIFGEYISTVSDDLRLLDDLFLKDARFPMQNMSQRELQAMRSNWEFVRETQKKAEQDLLMSKIVYILVT